MRIGVSLLNLRIGQMGGFETYVRKLVDYLPDCSAPDEVVFIVNRDNRKFVPDKYEVYEVPWGQRRTSLKRMVEALIPIIPSGLSDMFKTLKLDVIFHPHQAMFPVAPFIPSVVTVADIQHLYYPQYFALADRFFRALSYKRAVYRCDRIMAISEFTASCVVEKYGVSKERISVIHHGFEPQDTGEVLALEGIPVPYIYYPAASFPHKGHRVLFESFAELKRAGRIPHKLVLSGVRDGYWQELRALISAEGMDEEILDYGFVSYTDVFSLYSGADAVVFPTEYEGFGLPVLEAAQFGKKLICSKLSVFNEIGVPERFQIDFSDAEQLLERIMCSDPFLLETEAITWKDSIRQIYEMLRRTAVDAQESV